MTQNRRGPVLTVCPFAEVSFGEGNPQAIQTLARELASTWGSVPGEYIEPKEIHPIGSVGDIRSRMVRKVSAR